MCVSVNVSVCVCVCVAGERDVVCGQREREMRCVYQYRCAISVCAWVLLALGGLCVTW